MTSLDIMLNITQQASGDERPITKNEIITFKVGYKQCKHTTVLEKNSSPEMKM